MPRRARFDEANQNGEIPGGRKIDYVGFSDDKTTPDADLSEGRGLVEQQGVFGVVPVVTATLQAGAYFNQQKVPTIGWGIAPAFCDPSNKYVFGFTGCLVPNPPTYPGNTWGELVDQQLKSQGKGGARGKTAAVIAENNDSGKQGVEVISATAKAVGMKVVYQQASMPPLPATVTDYSPYVQAIMTSDNDQPPDVVFLVVGQNNVFGLGKALTQAGYKGIQTNAVSYAPQLTKLANTWSAFTQFADAGVDGAEHAEGGPDPEQRGHRDGRHRPAGARRVLLGRHVRADPQEGRQEPDARGVPEGGRATSNTRSPTSWDRPTTRRASRREHRAESS